MVLLAGRRSPLNFGCGQLPETVMVVLLPTGVKCKPSLPLRVTDSENVLSRSGGLFKCKRHRGVKARPQKILQLRPDHTAGRLCRSR